MSLLLVEDNPRLARSLVKGLEEEGLPTTHAATGQAAIDAFGRQPFDAIVLDLGLPDCDGLNVSSPCPRKRDWNPRRGGERRDLQHCQLRRLAREYDWGGTSLGGPPPRVERPAVPGRDAPHPAMKRWISEVFPSGAPV